MSSTRGATEHETRRIDATDRNILAVLQRKGRMTVTDVATEVSLSVSRTQRRLRDLENAGTIRGYHADVDYAALGHGFEAILFVTIRDLDRLAEVDAALQQIPQIFEAQRLFGDPDYLLRVREVSLDSYQRLYDDTLVKIPGVGRITSTIVLKTVVGHRPTPLGARPRTAATGGSLEP